MDSSFTQVWITVTMTLRRYSSCLLEMFPKPNYRGAVLCSFIPQQVTTASMIFMLQIEGLLSEAIQKQSFNLYC